MGQVELEPETAKWVDAVLKLIHMTQDGKLIWARQSGSQLLSSLSYETLFEGQRLVLEVRPKQFSREPYTLLNGLGDLLTEYLRVTLSVFDSTGETIAVFPSIPPLIGLLTAVRAQSNDREDAFLHSLSKAAE